MLTICFDVHVAKCVLMYKMEAFKDIFDSICNFLIRLYIDVHCYMFFVCYFIVYFDILDFK